MIGLCERCFYENVNPSTVQLVRFSEEPDICFGCRDNGVRVITEWRSYKDGTHQTAELQKKDKAKAREALLKAIDSRKKHAH